LHVIPSPSGPTAERPHRRRARSAPPGAWLLLAAALVVPPAAHAQLPPEAPGALQPPAEPGEIAGTVVDSSTAKPVAYANVALVDARLGANVQVDGTFRIRKVPPGTYQVRVSDLRYEPQLRQVTVGPGQTVELAFRLRKKLAAGTTKKIIVLDTRPLVDVSEISTVRQTRAEDIRKLAVDVVADVVTRQVGVSGEGDQLHVRGGRTDETLFRIESVAMKNVVTGAPVGGTLSAKAVQEIQVVTGGYQAELKEPGERRRSAVEYQTGSFDTQRLFVQTEGREALTAHLLPRLGLRVPGTVGLLLGADLLSTDTYLPSGREATNFANSRRSLRSLYELRFLGVEFSYDDFLRLRQKNSLNLYGKLTWRATPRHKVNFTFTKFAGLDHGFERFRVGDEVADASSADTPYHYEFKDQMDQYLSFTEDTSSQILAWKFAISDQAYSSIAASHFFNNVRQSVQGKLWNEYEPWTEPDTFFVEDKNNDYPYFQDLFVDRWSVNGSYTRRWRQHHEFKAGAEANYYTLQMIDIRNPVQGPTLPDGRPSGLGNMRDLYRVHPNDGAFYAQNQFKYEGFVGHVGLRGDYMFLGETADDAVAERRNGMPESVAQAYLDHTHELFGNRYKIFWSPRLGINHPITDRDEMHFNFGHFIQWPRLIYYFAKIGSRSSEAFPLVGNLDLDPQRSVQVEFGVKHQFTDNDAFDVTFFTKDVYDYPIATRPIEATARRLVYVNDDFSRTRGVELVLRRRAVRRFGGSVTYEYQIATGKPADPNRIKQVDPDALETGEAEPDLTEQFMPWNRPHRLQANLDWRFRKGDRLQLGRWSLPDQWGVNLFYKLQSGRPYTPTTIHRERIGKRNSKNAPFENVLDMKFEKSWELHREQRLAVVFQVRNLFDTRILRVIDPNTGAAQRNYAGVYTINDRNDLQNRRLDIRLANPAFYAEGRNLRLGLEVTF
jgi:outer membrane receptor protein involved in Fe transport